MFAFFRVSVAGSTPQTIVFKLDNDKCPKTCDNFIAICQSRAKAKRPTAGASSSHDVVEPTYRGTEFHRILPGFMVQGGDFSNFDGKGGFAAPTTNEGKPTFPDECFDISHNCEGILSMANRGKNTNGSQFFITLGKALHLDGKHVAFGSVVRGIECVKQIAQVETDGDGKPALMQRCVITDCGIGTGDDDSDSGSSSSSSSSASSTPKKKRRRRSEKYESSSKKKKRKRSDHSSDHRRRQRDKDDDDNSSNRKRKKKSKEKTSRRLETSKKRQKKNDERHHKRRRH
jgi:cyclophilin family peptidyl-prolyl cis-trans isomerase